MLSVSLCMIVRDEAQNLDEFFEKLPGSPDQIVVVDTGSKDGTPDILRARGIPAIAFPWCDDFAAARNQALEAATGDWILVLDADERLECGALDSLMAQASKAPDDVVGFVLDVRNYTDRLGDLGWRVVSEKEAELRGGRGYFPTEVVRFFRNQPEIRYRGRVHELVEPSIVDVGGRVVSSGVTIHHPLGDRNDIDGQSKRLRYLRLQELKIADEPQSAKAHWELGMAYLTVGRVDPGLATMATAWSLAPGNVEIGVSYAIALNDAGQAPRALAVLEAIQGQETSDARIEFQVGQALLAVGRENEARAAFRRAHELGPHLPQPLYWLARLDTPVDPAAALERLGAIRELGVGFWPGQLLEAELRYSELRCGGDGPDAVAMAVEAVRVALASEESLAELIGFARRACQGEHSERMLAGLTRDSAFALDLARVLVAGGETESAAAIIAHARSQHPDCGSLRLVHGELLLRDGQSDGALEIFQELDGDSQHGVTARYLRSGILISRGDLAAGAAALERVIAEDPSHANALVDLAGLHGNSGRVSVARELLEKANVQDPRNPLVHFNLALTSLLAVPPSPEEAKRSLTRARELGHPGDAKVEAHLTALLQRS